MKAKENHENQGSLSDVDLQRNLEEVIFVNERDVIEWLEPLRMRGEKLEIVNEHDGLGLWKQRDEKLETPIANANDLNQALQHENFQVWIDVDRNHYCADLRVLVYVPDD